MNRICRFDRTSLAAMNRSRYIQENLMAVTG
jgi:hypothetical protein